MPHPSLSDLNELRRRLSGIAARPQPPAPPRATRTFTGPGTHGSAASQLPGHGVRFLVRTVVIILVLGVVVNVVSHLGGATRPTSPPLVTNGPTWVPQRAPVSDGQDTRPPPDSLSSADSATAPDSTPEDSAGRDTATLYEAYSDSHAPRAIIDSLYQLVNGVADSINAQRYRAAQAQAHFVDSAIVSYLLTYPDDPGLTRMRANVATMLQDVAAQCGRLRSC